MFSSNDDALIVINPTIENGAIRATKVGERSFDYDTRTFTTKQVSSVDLIILGNAVCTELLSNPFAKLEPEWPPELNPLDVMYR